MTDPLDMTLDELRAALAGPLAAEAVFDGWSEAALAAAGRTLGVPADRARLAFPEGQVQMIDAWFASIDRRMIEALPPGRLQAMRIRERIAALVLARIEAALPHKEALRRALAVLGAAGQRRGRRAARVARGGRDVAAGGRRGDRLRALFEAAHAGRRLRLDPARLPRRRERGPCRNPALSSIAGSRGVMAFEKLKAQLKPDPDRHFNVARFLGRLRYPAR